jgi:YVTN family beta-propeller protein
MFLKNLFCKLHNFIPAVALFVFVVLWTSCGQTYRPIAVPVTQPGGDPEDLHFAVVLSQGSPGSLAQFDVSGDTNVGNKTVGTNPVHAMLLPSLGRGWVVNQGDSTVTVYSPTVVNANAITLALEANSGANYVNATNNFAFVTESSLNRLAIIDGTQLTVRSFVPVGNNPVAVAARFDGLKAYVLNNGDSTVTVVSTQDNSAVGSPIPVGASPVSVAMQTGGAFVYVVSDAGNSLSVIDTSTDTEIQRISTLSSPKRVIWDNNLKRVYVLNAGGGVSVFNASAAQLTLIRTVPTGASPLGLAVLDNGTKFYVLYGGSPGTVDVFDAQSFVVRRTVTVQNNPVSIAASPGSTKVYVVNQAGDPATPALANGSVSIIKTLDESVLNIPPSAPNPTFVTVQ